MAAEKVTDAHKVKPLADALANFVDDNRNADLILADAINQATKAETIEWLAAIAERYGFKAP